MSAAEWVDPQAVIQLQTQAEDPVIIIKLICHLW